MTRNQQSVDDTVSPALIMASYFASLGRSVLSAELSRTLANTAIDLTPRVEFRREAIAQPRYNPTQTESGYRAPVRYHGWFR